MCSASLSRIAAPGYAPRWAGVCSRAAGPPGRKARVALPSIPYTFDVELSHVERDLHLRLSTKVARHPSESLERLWLRLLAYCLFHQERIAFGPGLSDPEIPDLFADDLTGQKVLWVRVGRPDPERLQREADRAPRAQVAVLFDSPARLLAFVAEAREKRLQRLGKAELLAVDPAVLRALSAEDERRVRLSLTCVGDHLYVERGGASVDGALIRGNIQ